MGPMIIKSVTKRMMDVFKHLMIRNFQKDCVMRNGNVEGHLSQGRAKIGNYKLISCAF
jgi:hypothetical protein